MIRFKSSPDIRKSIHFYSVVSVQQTHGQLMNKKVTKLRLVSFFNTYLKRLRPHKMNGNSRDPVPSVRQFSLRIFFFLFQTEIKLDRVYEHPGTQLLIKILLLSVRQRTLPCFIIIRLTNFACNDN